MIWNFSFTQQYTNYSTKNGLPSNHVYRITQDINNFIWFITDKGMVKYNGTDFKKYTIRDGLPTNDIWNVVTTPNGKVWYFSKSSKIGYIDKDSIYAFPSAVKGEILNPMNRDVVGNKITFNNSIAHYQLKNKQWKADDNSGNYSKKRQYKTFLIHDKLHRFQFSEDRKQLIFKDKNNQTVKKIKTRQNIFEAHTRGQVNDSAYIWLSDKAYSVLNLNNYHIKTVSFKETIHIEKSKYVRMHVVNDKLQITGAGFVSILDKEYNLENTYYIPSHLKGHFSFIDKQDNLWVATFTNGVYKLPKSRQNATYSLMNDKIGKIKKIDNNLLTTVLDKGFYQYNKNTKQFEPYVEETNFAYGVSEIKELNTTYLITNKKIIRINNNKKTRLFNVKHQNDLNEIARQLVYHKNYLYGNFTAGLNKLNPSNLAIEKEYLLSGIRTFINFKESLIIATSDGLKILQEDSIKTLEFKKEIPNNLHKKPILSLRKLTDNSLLVGTDSYGAFITNLDKIIPLKGTEFLSINDSFLEKNNLWLATDKGVWHYKKDKDNNYVFIEKYDENDGLLLKNARSVYVSNKSLVITSNIGAVTIPKNKNKNQQLLDIYISKTMYNDKEIQSNKVLYTKNNTVNFSISNVDFSEKANFRYDYQLLPVQKKWISTTSKQLSFTNLPPNNYELHIKSKDKSNQVFFEITPLWHQTLLAKIIFGLGLFSLLVGIVLFVRKRELKKQAKKLQAEKKLADFELHALRSQMNPHFVFNSLNAIQYFITKNEIELSEKYLVKFAKLIRMFFDFSREKEITLQEEIKLLKGYLEIEKMRFGKDFKYQFNVDKTLNLSENTIPTMLLQPIVENAVNHGVFHNRGKGLIEVSFNSVTDKTYQIIITDDGVGVEKSRQIQEESLKSKIHKTTKSTEVINERIELLNQSNLWQVTYKLTNNLKAISGTTVQLTFTKNE